MLVENKLNKLKTFDLSYFIGKSHFEEDGTQNYLVFPPLFRYFKWNVKAATISSWKSKGLSSETIELPSTSNIGPIFDLCGGAKLRVKFIGGYLKQPKVSYTHKTIVNIYIVYELGASRTKNPDIDKYGYSGYWIWFDSRSSFSFPGTGFGQNVLIFGVDMSSWKKTY